MNDWMYFNWKFASLNCNADKICEVAGPLANNLGFSLRACNSWKHNSSHITHVFAKISSEYTRCGTNRGEEGRVWAIGMKARGKETTRKTDTYAER
jgi:hypothetical protein